jgi:hypothetical protein
MSHDQSSRSLIFHWGCNTFVRGSNARNASYPYLNYQKRFVFLIIAYVFSSTKLEITAEQVLPRSEGEWRKREGAGGEGEKWPKQCMHM